MESAINNSAYKEIIKAMDYSEIEELAKSGSSNTNGDDKSISARSFKCSAGSLGGINKQSL
jgi:hypothetical protein